MDRPERDIFLHLGVHNIPRHAARYWMEAMARVDNKTAGFTGRPWNPVIRNRDQESPFL